MKAIDQRYWDQGIFTTKAAHLDWMKPILKKSAIIRIYQSCSPCNYGGVEWSAAFHGVKPIYLNICQHILYTGADTFINSPNQTHYLWFGYHFSVLLTVSKYGDVHKGRSPTVS